jgi:hypothetical protein
MTDPIIADLDRCPHGRHRGDACAGHKGPGLFQGGCYGGYSLGNPWPYTGGGDRIGTTVHGHPILDTDLPAEGRPGWVWTRFRADIDDYRPTVWPPPGPYWCTGWGEDYSTVVAYLRPGDDITHWWPEASDVDTQERSEIQFADRFPHPAWWTGDGVTPTEGGAR